MWTASHKKHTPTTFKAHRSLRSRRCTSESTDILHNKAEPEVTSMKLSMPNPLRDTLPATAPAITATNPSKVFQPMVKYSSLRPRRRTAVRSNIAVSAMSSVYNVPRRAVGFAVSSELYDGYKGVKDRIHGRPHMRRSCLLIPVFLLISAPAFGQCTSTDSQPLQAL